jgi:hypothetical protein
VHRASIIMAMEAASASETSANFYKSTWRNSLEDSHLHTRHLRGIMKYHHNFHSSSDDIDGDAVKKQSA